MRDPDGNLLMSVLCPAGGCREGKGGFLVNYIACPSRYIHPHVVRYVRIRDSDRSLSNTIFARKDRSETRNTKLSPVKHMMSGGVLPRIFFGEWKFTTCRKRKAMSAMKLKANEQVISICAQVLRVTVLTARWRPVLESLFRCSPAESLTLSLSLSFLFTFLVFLPVAFILPSLSLSLFPLLALYSPSFSVFPSWPFSRPPSLVRSLTPILEFFYLHEEGKWNKMKKGGKNLNVGHTGASEKSSLRRRRLHEQWRNDFFLSSCDVYLCNIQSKQFRARCIYTCLYSVSLKF